MRRFELYISRAEPSNIDPERDGLLFGFVAWALMHDRDALDESFAYESAMTAQGFTANKTAYVHTILGIARPLVDAYERERRRHEQ